MKKIYEFNNRYERYILFEKQAFQLNIESFKETMDYMRKNKLPKMDFIILHLY